MGAAQMQSLTPTPLKHFGHLSGGGGGWREGWYQKPPLSLNHHGIHAIFTHTHPMQLPLGLLMPKATLLIIS